jgi:hypothetical protein
MEGKEGKAPLRRHHSFSIDDKVSSIAPTQPNISHRLLWMLTILLFRLAFVRSSLLNSVLLYTIYDYGT